MRLLVSGATATVQRLAKRFPDVLGVLLCPHDRQSARSVALGGLPWACDNAAFSRWDEKRYYGLIRRVRSLPGLLWVAVPDVVGNAEATLALWREWNPRLAGLLPLAFVLQDGQESLELPAADCYFVGGSTAFKLSEAAADLCTEAKRRGALLHMGRVNSLRRIRAAWERGCDSIDGTSASRFGDVKIPRYCAELRALGEWNNRLLF